MRIWDIHNDAGVYTGFEIRNIGRRRACRVASSVQGARIVRAPRFLRSSSDDFCAFEVDGVGFLIIEPFGDNSRFMVVAEHPSPDARTLIERVRVTFATARGWL